MNVIKFSYPVSVAFLLVAANLGLSSRVPMVDSESSCQDFVVFWETQAPGSLCFTIFTDIHVSQISSLMEGLKKYFSSL